MEADRIRRVLGVPCLLAACLLSMSGCGSSLESAKSDLLRCYSANTHADWRLEREQGRDGFYGVPHPEREIIAHGQAAIPIASEFMTSFDHRVRCSGLTILSAVKGDKGAVGVFVEHLDDPYGPIRWRCWHALHEAGVLPLGSMPNRDSDGIEQWRALKQACQVTVETQSTPPIVAATLVQ